MSALEGARRITYSICGGRETRLSRFRERSVQAPGIGQQHARRRSWLLLERIRERRRFHQATNLSALRDRPFNPVSLASGLIEAPRSCFFGPQRSVFIPWERSSGATLPSDREPVSGLAGHHLGYSHVLTRNKEAHRLKCILPYQRCAALGTPCSYNLYLFYRVA
jgi:hypothetical protein